MKAFILYIKELDGTEKEITVLDYALEREVTIKNHDTSQQPLLFEEEPPKT